MTETPISKLILQLGIPTTISMLITSIYNMADTYFVGTLGESAQAATGVLFTLQAIIQGLAFMFGHGGGTFISKELADRNTDRASMYISSSFFVGGFVGAIILAVGLLFLEPLVLLMGSTRTILPHAMDYGLWVLISCPFMICSMILNNGLRYEGKAFYAMFGLTAGGLLNILGDYLLVACYGMGVYGAGLATAVSQMISFVILLIMYHKMAQSKIRFRFISKEIQTYVSICRIGLPSLIRQGLTSATTGILNNLTKPFGDAAIAAMGVVSKYSMFLMCVGLGMGQGFQPVAAFNYRAKKYDRVKKRSGFYGLFWLDFYRKSFYYQYVCIGSNYSGFPEKSCGNCSWTRCPAIRSLWHDVYAVFCSCKHALSKYSEAYNFFCTFADSFRSHYHSPAPDWRAASWINRCTNRAAHCRCDFRCD